jgi:hypothetical protein
VRLDQGRRHPRGASGEIDGKECREWSKIRKAPHPRIGPTIGKRRAVGISAENLIDSRPLFASGPLPLVIEPRVPGLDLVRWAADNRPVIEDSLVRHGGVLSCRSSSIGRERIWI